MYDLLIYTLVFAVGIGIGLFYFGGLWLTTQQLSNSSQPALLVIASQLGRLVLSLLAFFLIAGGQWQRLIVSILGFFVARFLLLHYWHVDPSGTTTLNREGQERSSTFPP